MEPLKVRADLLYELRNGFSDRLNQIMDEICGPDESIRIDHLKMDLGNVNKENFVEEFLESFHLALKDIRSPEYESGERILSSSQLKKYHVSANGIEEKKNVAGMRKGTFAEELVLYLESGYFSWWSKSKSVNDLEVFIEEVLSDSGKNLLKDELKKIILKNEDARRRLVMYFKPTLVKEILDLIFPELTHIEEQLIRKLCQIKTTLSGKDKLPEFFQNALFLEIRISALKSGFESFLKSFFYLEFSPKWNTRTQVASIKSNYVRFINKTDSERAEHKIFTEILKSDLAEQKQLIKTLEEVLQISESTGIKSQSSKNEEVPKSSKEAEELLKVDKESNSKEERAHTGIQIDFAGIVILRPLIKPLFENRELLNENDFKGISERLRALQLLNYIASGLTNLEEHHMALNKVLCGIPIDEMVSPLPDLLEEDRAEAEVVMNHFISVWEAVKNSGFDAVRKGFIARPGELDENEKSYLLTVEGSGVDILMKKIPWGYDMVKLPWMDKILQVEWKKN